MDYDDNEVTLPKIIIINVIMIMMILDMSTVIRRMTNGHPPYQSAWSLTMLSFTTRKLLSCELDVGVDKKNVWSPPVSVFVIRQWGYDLRVWREAYFNSRGENENFFPTISCSRRERKFLYFNLVLRDENENFLLQYRASKRERDSRLRQFSREFSGITFIASLLTDIFKKRLLISQNFLR